MKKSERNLIKYPLSNLQQNIFAAARADTEELPLVTGLQQCSSCSEPTALTAGRTWGSPPQESLFPGGYYGDTWEVQVEIPMGKEGNGSMLPHNLTEWAKPWAVVYEEHPSSFLLPLAVLQKQM